MADNIQTGSTGHGGLYFIVGILVVVVGAIAYFAFGGNISGGQQKPDVNIKIETPAAKPKTQ